MKEKMKANLLIALLIVGMFFGWTLVGTPIIHYVSLLAGVVVIIGGILGSMFYFAFVCKWTQKLDEIAKGNNE